MRTTLLSLALLATLASPALGHEGGVISLSSKQIAVGSQISIRGEKLPKNSTLRMQLRGALETFPLAEVRTDSAGGFDARLALPEEVKAGTYIVVVVASDGDVAARADVVVTAAPASGMAAMPGMEEHPGMTRPPGEPGPHATAEMMKVPVSTSGAEWAAIVGIIVLSAAGGLVLLAARRSEA